MTDPTSSLSAGCNGGFLSAVDAITKAIHHAESDLLHDIAAEVLAALHALPVEQRMEAMGMERVRAFDGGCGDDECCGSYIEIEPDDDGDLWREKHD